MRWTNTARLQFALVVLKTALLALMGNYVRPAARDSFWEWIKLAASIVPRAATMTSKSAVNAQTVVRSVLL